MFLIKDKYFLIKVIALAVIIFISGLLGFFINDSINNQRVSYLEDSLIEANERINSLKLYIRNQPVLDSHKESQVIKNNLQPIESVFSISNDWLEITKENFWSRKDIFSSKNTLPYHFPPIKFSYPSNWKFNCCSGMDHAEAHYIVPLNDKGENIENSPSISILVHGLLGCSNVVGSCAMDKQIQLTKEEKYQRIIKNLPEGSKILAKKTLKGINKTAFVYTYSRFDPPIQYEKYLFIIDDEVVEIEFKKPEELDREFINSFLQKIQIDN